jgi:hypothetical protein
MTQAGLANHAGCFILVGRDTSLKRKKTMNDEKKTPTPTPERRCPECRAILKPRRGRTPDPCDLVCGGCGKEFNGCEIDKEPG